MSVQSKRRMGKASRDAALGLLAQVSARWPVGRTRNFASLRKSLGNGKDGRRG